MDELLDALTQAILDAPIVNATLPAANCVDALANRARLEAALNAVIDERVEWRLSERQRDMESILSMKDEIARLKKEFPLSDE